MFQGIGNTRSGYRQAKDLFELLPQSREDIIKCITLFLTIADML